MLVALTGLGVSARADDVRPVQVQIVEREPGAFLVQWLAPKVLEPQAIPIPVLPPDCIPEGEQVLLDQLGGWLMRQSYRCPDGLAGRTIGIHYPIHNPALTTIFRVELLTGERFAQALAPQEESWTLPEAHLGAVAGWLKEARAAVLAGLRHAAFHPVHVALALALLLYGGAGSVFRRVAAFAGGQLGAVAIVALSGRSLDGSTAEVCVAVAVVFLAREVLREEQDKRRLTALAGGAGLFHGLAMQGASWSELLLGVLGMDAALLILCLIGLGIARIWPWPPLAERVRPFGAYVVGCGAVVLALSIGLARPAALVTELASTQLTGPMSSGSGMPGSRRVAPTASTAPVQSFLSVEPFEIRHEVLIRLASVAPELGLEVPSGRDGVLEIDAQPGIVRAIGEFVAGRTRLDLDGEETEGLLDRAGFMTADTTGVLPRKDAVPEPMADALVGVTLVYLTDGMPDELALTWQEIGGAVPAIPATVIDPESSRPTLLNMKEPVLRWRNELVNDPVPTVTGVAARPPRVPVPVLSAVLLVAAVVLLLRTRHRSARGLSFAAARVTLASALLVAPLARVSVALPPALAGGVSEAQARRVLAGVLPNVYRAFEFREENAVYDRLSVAVTGETLGEVYLQHRGALEMEERGGARARVDAVEVVEVDSVEPLEDGGFRLRASWTVGGSVTHFGHRHFRQNRYHAEVGLVPADGLWKIRSIKVLEQERLR